MKNLFFGALVSLIAAPRALAEGFTPLAPIPGLTSDNGRSVINSTSLADFFNNLYLYLIGFAAIAAIIMIIWGGFEYATQDSISAKGAGKERIQEALFGLVLVLSPYLVFSIINPSILNLSLNLPKLNTFTPAAPVETGTAYAPSAANPTQTPKLPSGQFCYLHSAGTDAVTGAPKDTKWICFTSAAACTSTAKKDGGAVNGECPQQQ